MLYAAAKSLQSCPTLCDPVDGSPPGSPVPGILQARTLEWVAISFSNAWKWKGKVKSLSHVWLLATPWTAAYQAPPSMGFSRQECWSGLPLPLQYNVNTSLPCDLIYTQVLGLGYGCLWGIIILLAWLDIGIIYLLGLYVLRETWSLWKWDASSAHILIVVPRKVPGHSICQ